MNKKNIFLFLAGCSIIIMFLLFVLNQSSGRRIGGEELSSSIPQGLKLSEPVEREQIQKQEESVIEEEMPLPPGEPLLN